MRKLITRCLCFVLCFMFIIPIVNARPNITIDDVVAYTKAGLEQLKDADGNYKYTDVNTYNDSAKKIIEIEFTYQNKRVTTGIDYTDTFTILPGVHTLKDTMKVLSDNHANTTLDTAVDILKIFQPKNNKLFAEFVGYAEKDINKYLDDNGDVNNNGYQLNTEDNSGLEGSIILNFNNFNLGGDSDSPSQSIVKSNDKITLTITANEEDGTIIHIYRSLDNVNFEEYKDITIKNNKAELTLEGSNMNYYYKSVVERSNNWSEPVKYVKDDVNDTTPNPDNQNNSGSTTDKKPSSNESSNEISNPQTGFRENSILIFIVASILIIAYFGIRKFNKLNRL